MQNNRIEPKTLKGFKDYFGEDMIIREYIKNSFKKIAEKYGYEPLETPSLEYTELILGQSGKEAEKLYYRFKDQGDRDVMLKYELMTSMCRAVGQNINNIPLPYKRYQIQNVWRADNVQKGRLREFTQMDVDTIGTNSLLADAEIIQMNLDFLQELGLKNYKARISNRKILEGLTEYLCLPKESFNDIYITIDKLEKIKEEGVMEELENRGIPKEKAEQITTILKSKTLDDIKKTIGTTEIGKEGIEETEKILEILSNTTIPKENYTFDITLARGLASYTAFICEYAITDGEVGSIGGGGRYNSAIGKYTKQDIPATGASFGLERLSIILKEKNILNIDKTNTKALITYLEEDSMKYAIQTASELRENGINCILYPEITKLANIFKYAEKKNIQYVVIIGEEESKNGTLQVKNIQKREQVTLNIEETIKKLLK